jgi:hypothetical protein
LTGLLGSVISSFSVFSLAFWINKLTKMVKTEVKTVALNHDTVFKIAMHEPCFRNSNLGGLGRGLETGVFESFLRLGLCARL